MYLSDLEEIIVLIAAFFIVVGFAMCRLLRRALKCPVCVWALPFNEAVGAVNHEESYL